MRLRTPDQSRATIYCAACACPLDEPCACGWLVWDQPDAERPPTFDDAAAVYVPALGGSGSCKRHPGGEVPA